MLLATNTISRPGSQRLVCRMACLPQSVSVLCCLAVRLAPPLRRCKDRQKRQSLIYHSSRHAAGTLASLAHFRFAHGIGRTPSATVSASADFGEVSLRGAHRIAVDAARLDLRTRARCGPAAMAARGWFDAIPVVESTRTYGASVPGPLATIQAPDSASLPVMDDPVIQHFENFRCRRVR
jgi:hypothetical protein